MRKLYLASDGIIKAIPMFKTNEIYEPDDTYTYICKETSEGDWLIMRISETGVFSYASQLNNNSITTYADARSNVTTLTYGTYNEAQ